MKKYFLSSLFVIGSGLLISPLIAQDEEEDEDIYELSPFEVDSRGDSGYIATQTLSGTRLSTPLRDVAASVSVFTEEFLDDLQILNREELTRYTLSQEPNRAQWALAGVIDTAYANARDNVRTVRIRGLGSTPAINYFQQVYTDDNYMVARYDESRGPNAILFGIGNAGGINNTSTLVPTIDANFGRVRLTTQTEGGFRSEFRYNRSLIDDKLGIVVAAVNQEFDGYKHWSWYDTSRVYGALKFKFNDNFSLRAYGETGNRNISNENLGAIGSWGMMAWKDWSDAVGVENLVLAPANRNPNAAQRMYGIFNRTANANGNSERFVIVANDGAFFNDAGEYQTVEYGSSPVRGPDGWAPPDIIANGSAANQRLKVYREDLIDPKTSLSGPGQYRDEDFGMIGAALDIKITEQLYFELAYNQQEIEIFAPTTQGFNWQVSVDPNTTRGVPNYANGNPNPGFGGPNPFAGGYVLESNWGIDKGSVDQEAVRATLSFTHDFAQQGLDWLGSHNFAALVQSTEFDRFRSNQWFGFIGAPFSTNWNSADNRLQLRYYFDLEDLTQDSKSVHLPDWRDYFGQTIQYDGETYTIGAYNRNPGPNPNSLFKNELSSQLAVLQSYWWDRKIITVLGVREDSLDDTRYGYTTDPVYGPAPDRSIVASEGAFSGETYNAGAVFRLFEGGKGFVSGLDLLVSYSSNIGIPDTQQSVLPDASSPPPPDGIGKDIGIQFRLLDDKVFGKLVYYDVKEDDLIHGSGGPSTDLQRITDGLGNQLIAQGVYTEQTWADELASRGMDVTWTASTHDQDSKGWEFGLVGNPTPNLRLSFNASTTDRRQFNRNNDVGDAYGFISVPGPEGAPYEQYIEGFQFQDGVWRLQNASDFTPDGWVSQLIGLAQLIDVPGETFETYDVWNGRSLTRIIGERVRGLNRNKRQSERRSGLRPNRMNVWAVYDFTEGFLNGFMIGGGFNWEDKAVIGIDPLTKTEVTGPDILNTNMMFGYTWQNESGLLPGQWRIQANIDNVLNDTDPLLQTPHLYFDEVYFYDLPGDWGPATTRVDIIPPISARISLTYSF